MTQARAAVVCGCYLASRPHGRCSCRREHVWRKAPREHRGKCGGRARQPRRQLTGCLWELPPAFACRGSHAPPRSGACRLTARHGGANSAQGTQGAPRKMQRQGAATPGSTHRVSVGCAPSLRLPRQPQTAPLRRLPPAPLPIALRLKNNIVNIFLGGKSREFAFPKIVQRIVHRVGKRARAAPCCARCTPRAALTRRASHAAAPRPCAQHHSACAGPRRRAAHRVPILKN
jgi:hypothetical protein